MLSRKLTVELSKGSGLECDPNRVYGVTSTGRLAVALLPATRLQSSALNKELGISNRDMGTITKMEPDRLTVLMDGKKSPLLQLQPVGVPAVPWGLTADRVIANIDTDAYTQGRMSDLLGCKISDSPSVCTAQFLGRI